MYEDFKSVNQSFQTRVEAFTSGILSPDTKGLTLQSMDPSSAYTMNELYNKVCAFCGCDPLLREFPLADKSIWKYCDGQPYIRWKGSLDSIGVVVKLRVKTKHTPFGTVYSTAYRKTDAGEDFGDPIVAMGTHVVNEMAKRNLRYSSLRILLGSASKKVEARYRSGYTRFKLIEFLAENPKEEFRTDDIIQALPELNYVAISGALNALGQAGVIDYYSPYRDVGGKRTRGWAEYALAKKISDEEKVISEFRKLRPMFTNVGCLHSVLKCIIENPNGVYENNQMSKKLGTSDSTTSICLSTLADLGFLSARLQGRNIQAIGSANEITTMLWEELFEPIRRVSYNLNPSISGFRDRLDYYLGHREEWRKARMMQLRICDKERTNIGIRGGEEIRSSILRTLTHKEMKASHVLEEVNRSSPRKVKNVARQLRILERKGQIKKVRKGYYALIEEDGV